MLTRQTYVRLVLVTTACLAPGWGAHAQDAKGGKSRSQEVEKSEPAGLNQQPATTPNTAASLPDLIARAGSTYPSLVAARERRRRAEYQSLAAGAFPSVMLNAGGHVGEAAAGDDEDIWLSGKVELGRKRGLRMAVAERELQAARADEAFQKTVVSFLVRDAYAVLQGAVADEKIAREHLSIAETFLRLSRIQFDAGDVPMTTLLRAEIEVENATQNVTAAQATTFARTASINVLIAAEPSTPLALPEIALVPPVEASLTSLQEQALGRPDLRAARAILSARRSMIASARAARRPDLVFDAVHGRLNEASGNVFRAAVTFPIYDFGLARANAGAAKASAEEQEANVDLLRRQVLQDVETAHSNLLAARRQAEKLGGVQLERARRLRDLAELGYREGQFSYLEYLDAQRAYLGTFTLYVRAVAAANAADAALRRAIGQE